jgi:hypothetical protein
MYLFGRSCNHQQAFIDYHPTAQYAKAVEIEAPSIDESAGASYS